MYSCFSAPLTVHLQPQVQTIDVDKDAHFQCITSGFPVENIKWLHNGKPVIADDKFELLSDPPRLTVKKIQKDDHGMYQCFVSNEWEHIQSTAELQLGGECNT
jgi:Immunoglobulin I-set domain